MRKVFGIIRLTVTIRITFQGILIGLYLNSRISDPVGAGLLITLLIVCGQKVGRIIIQLFQKKKNKVKFGLRDTVSVMGFFFFAEMIFQDIGLSWSTWTFGLGIAGLVIMKLWIADHNA